MTVDEAANALFVSTWLIRKLCQKGVLKCSESRKGRAHALDVDISNIGPVLTPSALAGAMGCSTSNILRLIYDQRLCSIRLGDLHRIQLHEAQKLLSYRKGTSIDVVYLLSA